MIFAVARLALLLVLLSSLFLSGCVQPLPPIPVPPRPQPQPPQPEPRPPAPVETVTRATMETVEVGSPAETLSALPEPTRKVETMGYVIWVWVLDEPRVGGGLVQWEVVVGPDGQILASRAW